MWTLTDPTVASIRELVDEWRKCRVLCMNCHMEQKHGRPGLTKTSDSIA
jgi:hypothetical protein